MKNFVLFLLLAAFCAPLYAQDVDVSYVTIDTLNGDIGFDSPNYDCSGSGPIPGYDPSMVSDSFYNGPLTYIDAVYDSSFTCVGVGNSWPFSDDIAFLSRDDANGFWLMNQSNLPPLTDDKPTFLKVDNRYHNTIGNMNISIAGETGMWAIQTSAKNCVASDEGSIPFNPAVPFIVLGDNPPMPINLTAQMEMHSYPTHVVIEVESLLSSDTGGVVSVDCGCTIVRNDPSIGPDDYIFANGFDSECLP